ncbi:MAG: hypothetical protein OJF52_001533 [Nitrospira sp.]|nr:MAG: hypothetical protein OJF52_001533 [Nitrospira sp.]
MGDSLGDAPWIKTNVEAVIGYLTREFENFAVIYQADRALTHTFTVNNGKKLFKLILGWSILADKNFTSAPLERLAAEDVAQEMRLHGESGYRWNP